MGWTFLILILYQSYIGDQNVIIEKIEDEAMPKIGYDRQLLVNENFPPSEKEYIKEIIESLSNLPTMYWNEAKNIRRYYMNKTCAILPSMYNLQFDNTYWQTLRSSNGTFYFFNAYFDSRLVELNSSFVRIIAMIDRVEPTVEMYCQLWFAGRWKPLIVKADYTFMWVKGWGIKGQGLLFSYLINCPMSGMFLNILPDAVSVVEKPCDNATNNLRVIYNVPKKKKNIAVCVKGLDFYHEDLSVRLVEWFELLFLLGADKVFLYQLQVHPNISKVLKYYEEKGKVEVTHLTLPGGQPNAPVFQHEFLKHNMGFKRRNEILPYNDCLYKNLYSYKYVVLLDTDEIIIPVNDPDWVSLMEKIKSEHDETDKYASFSVRNVYFFDDLIHNHGWFENIPKYMHMMQHVNRVKNFTKKGYYVKCFHDTQKVLSLHNHYPFDCLDHKCKSYSVDTEDAQLQHYRRDCVAELKKACGQFKNDVVMDTTIWRYKENLIPNVLNSLTELGFSN